jgi:hypothetical protein
MFHLIVLCSFKEAENSTWTARKYILCLESEADAEPWGSSAGLTCPVLIFVVA